MEVSLPQLTHSLDALKAAKARCALLDIFSTHCGQSVTTAAALPALRYNTWLELDDTLPVVKNDDAANAVSSKAPQYP